MYLQGTDTGPLHYGCRYNEQIDRIIKQRGDSKCTTPTQYTAHKARYAQMNSRSDIGPFWYANGHPL